ncbi:MAG: RNA methyltransferase [Pseudomonadota bacterium]
MVRTLFIDQPDDPRIVPYTQIRERDLTGRGDRFIVEGKVTLEVLLRRGRFEIESLFLCETRLGPLAPLLALVPDGVPIYTAPQAVMDQVAGFPVHRGVLACARKGAPLPLERVVTEAASARSPSGQPPEPVPVILVAIGLSNHDNVGALFRNAAGFGAGAVILDGESCDPLYRKAIRVSAGTCLWLPFVHGGTSGEILEAVRAAGFAPWALTPNRGAISLYATAPTRPVALIVGAEGPGLPDAVIGAAEPVRIPMAPDVDSLNVATSAAVALSWLRNRAG